MRICLLLDKGLVKGAEWDDFFRLNSHEHEISQGHGQWAGFDGLINVIKKYSRTKQPLEVVHKIACTIMTNSLPLHDATLSLMGQVLHPRLALLNHSCSPNAVLRTDVSNHYSSTTSPNPIVGSISLHALRPIAVDEEITIAYTELTEPPAEIHDHLHGRYFFDCGCTPSQADSLESRTDPKRSQARTFAKGLLEGNDAFGSTGAVRIFSHRAALTALAALQSNRNPIQLGEWPYLQHRLKLINVMKTDTQSQNSLNALQDVFLYTAILVFRVPPSANLKPFEPTLLAFQWDLLQQARRLTAKLRGTISGQDRSIMTLLDVNQLELFAMFVLASLKENLHKFPFQRPDATTLQANLNTKTSAEDRLKLESHEIAVKTEDLDDIVMADVPDADIGTKATSPAATSHMSSLMHMMVDELIEKIESSDERIAWSRFRTNEDQLLRELQAWIDNEMDQHLAREKSGDDWRHPPTSSSRNPPIDAATFASLSTIISDYHATIALNRARVESSRPPTSSSIYRTPEVNDFTEAQRQQMAVREARGRPSTYRADGMLFTTYLNPGEMFGPRPDRSLSVDDMD